MTTEPVASIAAPASDPPASPAPAAPEVVPEVQAEQAKEPAQEGKQENIMSDKAVVSAAAQEALKDLPVVRKEERIEYRDESGRVLDDDEVSALAGKVSFKTRYETRTRVVDGEGNEIYEGLVDAHGDAEEHGVAPPHPDVEGQNPETRDQAAAPEANEIPATVEVAEDQKKEAQPASEAQSATKQAE